MQTMRRGTWVRACVGVSLLTFSGVASAQGRGPGPFAGSFSISSATTVSVTSPMTVTEERSTRERLEIGAGSRSDASIQVTNDLGEHCTLSANRSGDSGITFGSGQRCTFTDSVRSMRMNFTLRSGSGSMSGDSISLSFNWSVASAGGFISVSGTATQRSSGRRTGGQAMADTPAPQPVAMPTPVMVAPSSEPAAIVAAPQPAITAVAPMMPMTGTTRRRPTTTTRRPTTTAAARPATVVVAPTPAPAPVVTAVTPTPVAAPASAWGAPSTAPATATNGAPASAWGAPAPATATPTVATGWNPMSTGFSPVTAETPGATVHPSGWILGPLLSGVAAAVPYAAQQVGAWGPQPAPAAPVTSVPWGSAQPTAPGSTWGTSGGGPGVVLGATGAPGAPSQGFGVNVSPNGVRPANLPSSAPSGGGPGIVFGASP